MKDFGQYHLPTMLSALIGRPKSDIKRTVNICFILERFLCSLQCCIKQLIFNSNARMNKSAPAILLYEWSAAFPATISLRQKGNYEQSRTFTTPSFLYFITRVVPLVFTHLERVVMTFVNESARKLVTGRRVRLHFELAVLQPYRPRLAATHHIRRVNNYLTRAQCVEVGTTALRPRPSRCSTFSHTVETVTLRLVIQGTAPSPSSLYTIYSYQYML